MRVVQDYFDELHFTECLYGKPVLIGTSLQIPVSGLMPLRGHPLCGEGPLRGRLHFKTVARSDREVTEYIGDSRNPDGFREPYIVEDLQGAVSSESEATKYIFEGVQEEPEGWVDWTVCANRFELMVE